MKSGDSTYGRKTATREPLSIRFPGLAKRAPRPPSPPPTQDTRPTNFTSLRESPKSLPPRKPSPTQDARPLTTTTRCWPKAGTTQPKGTPPTPKGAGQKPAPRKPRDPPYLRRCHDGTPPRTPPEWPNHVRRPYKLLEANGQDHNASRVRPWPRVGV